jgi:polyhydroxyalkanoate synthesis regulator phasin
MAGFGDLVQKAFYLGVGAASYAVEKAGGSMSELRSQVQKLVDEMVAKGEITAEEAKGMVDDMLKRAQSNGQSNSSGDTPANTDEPRRIEIIEENTSQSTDVTPTAEELRRQVEQLQEELKQLKKD